MLKIGGVSKGVCGCCQVEHDDAVLVDDVEYGKVCVGCDLYLMEQACDERELEEA